MAVAAASRAIMFSPVAAAQSPMALFVSKRLLHFSSTAAVTARPLVGLRLLRHSQALVNVTRIGSIRSMARRADSAYSPLSSGSRGGSGFSDRPPTEMAPLFPGCDYEHWLIVMDKPGGEGATKQQMIDCYVQTLAKILGSEEEAKKKIYNVSCERYFGFGCEIDEETSNKLEGLPGVLFVLPDSYVDAESKDYGAELFVNGEIVQRPPERQRRIDAATTQRNDRDRPRYNDRTRYVRRRESQR
ncbi:multiple organellar RNA editing factor 2, chloroplastic-like [Canna indica]|uniref:Multiple organellar RNA editing factor 2, chloroplastic-like n=1 Tax=Canna indica TaxID=4628 RepID=A0AAQ3K0Y9_9LILI|nr:multiple organellar RNA editing factor 2, chloroplastic-like [Canna indica]